MLCYSLLLIISFFRDLSEYRQHNDSILSEMKRKDMLIKELQFKLEHNEGCKYIDKTFHPFPFKIIAEKHFHYKSSLIPFLIKSN